VHFWKLARDEEGRIRTWTLVDANPPTLKSWGRTLDEIKGKTTDEIFGPGATDHYMPVVQKIMEEGIPYSFEDYFPNLDKHFRFTSIPLGEYFITTGADISILKRAEELLKLRVEEQTVQLRDAYDKLQVETEERERAEAHLRQTQKMEALGVLSGGVAHDFNNILAAIVGFAELLSAHTAKGSRDERHVQRIMEASLRGRELVKQMLTFGRRTEQEKKPLLLSAVVKETANLLRATTPSTVAIRVNTTTESGMILGDPTQLQQLVMNLCTNAVYAMREKGGILTIGLSDFCVSTWNETDRIKPGFYMKLIVADTGSGIPRDIVDKVYDPFFTTKKLGEGTGLGLSVVHGIVRDSNGYITVQSEPGKGSIFTVYFPKLSEEAKTPALTDDEIPTGQERILFIDDEEALVEMGEAILAELGYEVTSRMSSTEALSLFKEDPHRFDLVITDQTMPDATGIDLAKEILALRRDMPIIMCTGFSHLVDAGTAKAAGIRAFAMKPLTKQEIARIIRQVLDRPGQ
jgi:signal transduction histidine kinase/ActR/RegA family two-component response regulator